MIGAYAGELGQTQFLPSSYLKYGVDYDGNGHVDLRRSVPDVLASTANLLKVNGWKTGQPFGEGTGEFPGDARVEPLRAVPQGDALFCAAAGGEVRGVMGASQSQFRLIPRRRAAKAAASRRTRRPHASRRLALLGMRARGVSSAALRFAARCPCCARANIFPAHRFASHANRSACPGKVGNGFPSRTCANSTRCLRAR